MLIQVSRCEMQHLSEKLALGTVQLGLPYGINNKSGKPDVVEANRILDLAEKSRIRLLDSAEAYGDALDVIGNYIQQKSPAVPFGIISKFIGSNDGLEERLDRTLAKLGIPKLYAYLYHRFSDYQAGSYQELLSRLKDIGKIQRIGVSIYSEEELESTLNDPNISLIQVPFNLLDSSESKMALLREAKRNGKEIHARSIFLQGLFFVNPTSLNGRLQELRVALQRIQKISTDHKLSTHELCLNYALQQDMIDVVVVGVETAQQLEANLAAVKFMSPQLIDELRSIPQVSKELVNPATWKL